MTTDNEKTGLETEEFYSDDEYSAEDKKVRATKAYNKEADEIWARTQALKLPANHAIQSDIGDHLAMGKLDRAKAKLARLEAKKVDDVEEQKQAWIKEGNLQAGGETATAEQDETQWNEVRAKFASNPRNTENTNIYLRMRAERGV